MPITRDEHSCIVYYDSMVVFGGFMFGKRTNSIFMYHFKANTWEEVHCEGYNMPCERVGHSAAMRYDP